LLYKYVGYNSTIKIRFKTSFLFLGWFVR